jgi:hypothetical protein
MNIDFRMGSDATADGRQFNRTKVDIEVKRQVGDSSGNDPFIPRLVSDESFKITWGYVVETIPGSADPVRLATPPNIAEEHEIAVGQQITIRVDVGKDGKMITTDPVTLEIGDEDAESVHYYPISGDDATGRVGYFRYKIAVLKAGESGAKDYFEFFLAGSHIHLGQSLPLLENTTTSGGRVLKGFDPDTGRYIFRQVLADPAGQLTSQENEDDVAIRGNSKNLIITYTIGEDSPVTVAEFEDGLETTGTDAETVPTINIPIPLAATTGYTGVIEIYEECGSVLNVLTFTNGLLTDYEEVI